MDILGDPVPFLDDIQFRLFQPFILGNIGQGHNPAAEFVFIHEKGLDGYQETLMGFQR